GLRRGRRLVLARRDGGSLGERPGDRAREHDARDQGQRGGVPEQRTAGRALVERAREAGVGADEQLHHVLQDALGPRRDALAVDAHALAAVELERHRHAAPGRDVHAAVRDDRDDERRHRPQARPERAREHLEHLDDARVGAELVPDLLDERRLHRDGQDHDRPTPHDGTCRSGDVAQRHVRPPICRRTSLGSVSSSTSGSGTPDWSRGVVLPPLVSSDTPVASTTTTVMLSRPPAVIASVTSRSAAAWGSGVDRSTSQMRSSASSPVSPSEQTRTRSWRSIGTYQKSTWGALRGPSARVTTCLRGWVRASAGVSSPASTISWTSEWSTLTCSSRPPARWYVRESPTLTTSQYGLPSCSETTTPVTVVP